MKDSGDLKCTTDDAAVQTYASLIQSVLNGCPLTAEIPFMPSTGSFSLQYDRRKSANRNKDQIDTIVSLLHILRQNEM